jgi:Tfp pilus assembly protein PilN
VGDRPSLGVAVGLALAGREVAEGAHRLDLLPPVVGAPAVRRHALLAGAAVLATAVGLGALWLGRSAEADDTQAQADQLEAELVTLGVTVGDLSAVYDLEAEVDAREDLIGEVLDGDVAWTKLLQEIATVQPDDVWLRKFTAKGPNAGEPGFTVSGRGVDHTSAARWQIRMQGLPTVEDVWVPRSQRAADDALNRFGEVEFDSNGELTDEALSDRIDFYVPLDPEVLGLEPLPDAAGLPADGGAAS